MQANQGLTTDECERLKQLEREDKELCRAYDILKAASAFLRRRSWAVASRAN